MKAPSSSVWKADVMVPAIPPTKSQPPRKKPGMASDQLTNRMPGVTVISIHWLSVPDASEERNSSLSILNIYFPAG